MNQLESNHLFWLDTSVDEDDENRTAQGELRTIIDQFQTFTQVANCEQSIGRISADDRIFLIVSGGLGQQIVPRIHQYRQIFAIYVYCMDIGRNAEWAGKFKKIRVVLDHLDELTKRLREDLKRQWESKVDEPLKIYFAQSNEKFLYSQLFFDYLFQFKSTSSNEKKDLLNFCENLRRNNPNEMRVLREFDTTYISNRTIWWYTRDSTLSRLLNKALRTENLEMIFRYAFFLRDLEGQLRSLQSQTPIRCFRGQLMSNDELIPFQHMIGGFCSIQTFLSTTNDRSVAIKSLQDQLWNNELQRVLFEVQANPVTSDRVKPFANTGSYSFSLNKQEILFMCGSIFRINAVQRDAHGVWLIQLTYTPTDEPELQELLHQMNKESNLVDNETVSISLGNLLYQMGHYDLAEKHFQNLAKETSQDFDQHFKCLLSLAMIALMKDNFDQSLQWSKKASTLINPDDSGLAQCYYCMACVYQKRADHPHALEFYDKASNVWRNLYGDDYLSIADCLNNIGCIYELDRDYSKAFEYHHQAFIIRQKILPQHHRDLAASFNNIGNIYLATNEFDLAIENYQSSLDIKSNIFPADHSSLATTLENLGLSYEQKGSFEEALTCYKKAANIFRKTYPANHPCVINIEEDIQHMQQLLTNNKQSRNCNGLGMMSKA